MQVPKHSVYGKMRNLKWLLKSWARIESDCLSEESSVNLQLSLEFDARYDACRVLSSVGIASMIWGEGALAILGVPTILWDVFILVEDPKIAAQYILKYGFVRTKPNPRFEDVPEIAIAPRLAAPLPSKPSSKTPPPVEVCKDISNDASGTGNELADAQSTEDTGVVLLSAKYWPHNTLGQSHQSFVPRTCEMLNCLISTYMGAMEFVFREYIAIHISYFYMYVQSVRNPGFETLLLKESRQLHFDMLHSKDTMRTLLSAKQVHDYHRDAREKIRRGELEPGCEKVGGKEAGASS